MATAAQRRGWLPSGPERQLTGRGALLHAGSGRWWRGLPSLRLRPRPALQLAARAQARPDQQPALPVEWEQQRMVVAAFAARHGRLPRAAGTKAQLLAEGERPLGLWCADQQRRRGGSKGPALSTAEQIALETIPGWAWTRKQGERLPWQQWLQHLMAFVAQHDRLPRNKGLEQSPLLPWEQQLGMWCDRQRQRWKGNKQPPLTAAEQAALEAIPGWFWEKYDVAPWEQRLQQVAAFVAQHGRLPRTESSQQAPLLPGERQLGQWCSTQRYQVRGNKQPARSAQQQAALEAIPGWYWDLMELWERQREAVKAFVERHGRLPRSTGSQTAPLLAGERQLGQWCAIQRLRRKGSSQPPLTAAQQAALEATPSWFWECQEPWDHRLQQVAAFAAQHGRLPRQEGSKKVPLLPGEEQLGLWCSKQRRQRKGSVQPPLSAERQAALEAIPGWYWEPLRMLVLCNKRCQQVAAFAAQHGRLPRRSGSKTAPLVEGEAQLGEWCKAQRQRRRGTRQPALEGLWGWRW